MKRLSVLLSAAVLTAVSSAETWTWIGGSPNRYSNGQVQIQDSGYRDWRDGTNWVDSAGARGSLYPDTSKGPQAGDTIIFDNTFVYGGTAVGASYTHTFGPVADGSYGSVVFRGTSNAGSYGPQVPVADGGSVRYEIANASIGNQSFMSTVAGTIEFYVAGTVESHFKTIGTLRKTGAGTLRMYDGGGSEAGIGTLRLEAGTLALRTADGRDPLRRLGAGGLVFAGAGVTLDLNGTNSCANAGAGLSETAVATGHRITSAKPGQLTLCGEQSATTFSGAVTGAASLCWNPSGDVALALTGDVDTTGTLTVSNGTLDVSAAKLGAQVRFAVGGTGRLALPTGVYGGRLTVDGEHPAAGWYTGTGSRGTQVAWLAGDGSVIVGAASGTEALWTAAGSLGTAANWNGASETPDLTRGSTILKTTTPVAGATADVAPAFLYGLSLGGGADFAFTGAEGFLLGAGGIVLTGAAKTVTLETPLAVAASQLWDLSNGGALRLKTPVTTLSPGATVTITNGSVRFYGGTQDVSFVCSEAFSFENGTETVFRKKVTMRQRAAGSVPSGNAETRIVYDGGLELCNSGSTATDCDMSGTGTTVFTNGILSVYDGKRVNFTGGGSYHFHSPGNSFNNAQRGWISGGAVLYFHATNAFTSTQANLAGYRGDGGTIDLCGCDQTIGSIQCGRGSTKADGTAAPSWKWAAHPGTIRSERPALLRITDGRYMTNPSGKSSPTSTNCAFFVGQAGLSFESSDAKLGHWLNQTCSSTGTVQAAGGHLHFSRRVVDGDGCDLGEGSWPNAARVVAKGAGVVVVEHGKAFGKRTDVALEGTGRMQLDAGVVQVCRNLYFDGVAQTLGTWGSPESAAEHTDARFTGTGILRARGEHPGCVLIFK